MKDEPKLRDGGCRMVPSVGGEKSVGGETNAGVADDGGGRGVADVAETLMVSF